MPEKTPGQIKADAAEYIRENGSKEILPTAIRNRINDICDSFLARDYGDGAKLPVATTVDQLIGQQSDGTVVRIADDALATQVGALVTPALNASVSAAAGSAAAAAAARDAALFGKGVFPSTAAALGLGVIGHGPITGGSGGTNGTFPLAFTGGTGSGAAGRFVVAGGALVAIFITAPGAYTVAPTFSFAASSGLTGASATAVLGVNADVGEYFSVPAGDDAESLLLYRVDAGPVATLIKTYPAQAYVDAIAGSRVDGKFVLRDELGNIVLLIDDDGALLPGGVRVIATEDGAAIANNGGANLIEFLRAGGFKSGALQVAPDDIGYVRFKDPAGFIATWISADGSEVFDRTAAAVASAEPAALREQPASDVAAAAEGLPPTDDELAAHIRKGHVPPAIEAQWRRLRPDLDALLESSKTITAA